MVGGFGMRLLPLLAALLLSVGVARAQSSSATMNAGGTSCPLNCVSVPIGGAGGIVGVQTSGLNASGATLIAESSVDGVTWSAGNLWFNGQVASTITGADGLVLLDGQGNTRVRLRVSIAGSGTIGIAFYPQASSLDLLSRYYLSLLASGAAKAATTPGQLIPVGTFQSTSTFSSAVGLPSIPTGATKAVVQIVGGTLNYTDDGSTTPTGSAGMQLGPTSGTLFVTNPLSNLKFFLQTGSPAVTMNVLYYK